MLLNLHVKNLALIEEADVEFGPGLNILTGETGAGKSILLGSIQLILGGKPSREMIRQNSSSALVELLFQVDDPETESELSEMGIQTEEGQVLLTRKITEGRSVCRINGETGTVSLMKAAAACLLDIHGQHEHQSLLYPAKQLEILDAFGGSEIAEASRKTMKAHQEYSKARKLLSSLDMDEEARKREMAFLEFEVNEIEAAALQPGEDEELEKLYRKLTNSRRISETIYSVHEATGGDRMAADLIGNASSELSRLVEYDEELSGMRDTLADIEALLEDFNREISSYMDSLVFDEETFHETEERLNLINDMKSRYGRSVEEIFAYRDRQAEKLSELQNYEENLKKASADMEAAKKNLQKESLALSKLRKKYAASLEQEIIRGLKELNFLDVRFEIRFTEKECASDGMDSIEYQIATNPGESLLPLGRIVSGGELSRIMLAIKTILADRDRIGTLIFDEIDTGISGRTAQMVALKMAEIGRHRQVICITHLPQIAAMADRHFGIEKHGDEISGTATEIHELDEEQSVNELARLLGGVSITEAVLQNAREMKSLAGKEKCKEK